MGTAVEKKLESAVRLLREFIPETSRLYFPLIYAFLSWAGERHRNWKNKILGWQIWPDPRYIRVKPDAFVLDFFRGHPGLRRAFRRELETGDAAALRPAFLRLYPLLGLEDPFLTALFHDELRREDYPAVLQDFDTRLAEARRALGSLPGRARLLKALKTLAEETVSLGVAVLDRSDVRRMIAEIIKKRRSKADA